MTSLKNLAVFISLAFLLLTPVFSFAQTAEPVTTTSEFNPTIYFFRGEGCPHCADEEAFFSWWQKDNPDVVIKDYEVWYNSKNAKLMKQVGDALGTKITGVPFTIIGDKSFVGYLNDATTGKQINNYIVDYRANPNTYHDIVAPIVNPTPATTTVDLAISQGVLPDFLTLPFFGDFNLAHYSLIGLTVTIGLLDGFNPCAMWVLILLISLLLGIKDKFRRWLFGFIFLAASAVAYFLFLAAWLNFILFIGFIIWVRLAIGLIALGGGGWNIWEWYKTRPGVCEVTNDKQKTTIADRLRAAISKESFWLATGALIIIAFAVNLVELMCSAGLPAIYTSVLALSDLSIWQYYSYLLLYLFFFILDDIIVFIVAMWTMQLSGLSSKYTNWSSLIGGLLMLLLGLILIFKPELLLFG